MPITSWLGTRIQISAYGVVEMTLFLRRSSANFRSFAIGVAFLALLTPLAVDAQHTSTKSRAAPPAKTRPAAKAARPAWVPNPGVSRDSYLIADATSGRELLSDQPD